MINSKKKIDGLFLLFSFNSWQLILCFVFAYSLKSVSFHLLRICVFLVSHFFEFSCWLSSTNNLIWIFVAFVAFIEVVSLWLVMVIVIGKPVLIAAKCFFLRSFKKEISYLWNDLTQHLPFPFSYLLTKNFRRCCCLLSCWSILTLWSPSYASKTSQTFTTLYEKRNYSLSLLMFPHSFTLICQDTFFAQK